VDGASEEVEVPDDIGGILLPQGVEGILRLTGTMTGSRRPGQLNHFAQGEKFRELSKLDSLII
jgi:hypothetical protein